MNADEARAVLAQSLADRRLTGSERLALTDWLDNNADSDQERGIVRHLAFDLARENSHDPNSIQVLEWLEDLLKVIAPVEKPTPAVPTARPAGKALFSPGEAILNHLIDRFDSAKRSVDICVFTITDDRISREILEAHRRKVRIRIISDNDKAHDLGSDLFRFREAGIAVKFDERSGPPSEQGHMHHKFAIFDATHLVNGSYNWTRGAVTLNHENLVDLTDPNLVKVFQAEFDRLWNRF